MNLRFLRPLRGRLDISAASKLLLVCVAFHLASGPVEGSERASPTEDRCTFSKLPILNWILSCRALTETRERALRDYWESEDDAELCHYFYFPLADPSASEALLITNYTIMAGEITRRGVDCVKDHRNIFWYRGRNTRSMLEKYEARRERRLHEARP